MIETTFTLETTPLDVSPPGPPAPPARGLFFTISGDDWKRSLRMARERIKPSKEEAEPMPWFRRRLLP